MLAPDRIKSAKYNTSSACLRCQPFDYLHRHGRGGDWTVFNPPLTPTMTNPPSAQLPSELLSYCLASLDPADPATAITLARFGASNRLFRSLAGDQRLWRRLYLSRWRRHKSMAQHIDLLLHDGDDNPDVGPRTCWKRSYGRRHRADRCALESVQKMAAEPAGKYLEARTILQDDEMNVYDALLTYQNDLVRSTPMYEKLGDKVWVQEVLDALRRSETLQTWSRMLNSGGQISFVEVISAFSGFRGADKVDMEERLDRLASHTEKSLGKAWLESKPDILEVVKGIIDCMDAQGLRGSRPADFHRLRNHFLNLVIDRQG